jgi:hypothetical protein
MILCCPRAPFDIGTKRQGFTVVSADDGFEQVKEMVDLAVERRWSL